MRSSIVIALANLAAAGLLLLGARQALRWYRTGRNPLAGFLSATCAALALPPCAWALVLLGLPLVYNRDALHTALSDSLHYKRHYRATPRPHFVHVLTWSLRNQPLDVSFTRPAADLVGQRRPYRAQTTSHFLRARGCLAATNASFFTPYYAQTPLTYYPHSGEPVSTMGRYGQAGRILGKPWSDAIAYLTPTGAHFRPPQDGNQLLGVVEGRRYLVQHGQAAEIPASDPAPRTALSMADQRLQLVVVDGKLTGLTEGLTLQEMAALLIELGADTAIELDGGGSSTLVLANPQGKPQAANLLNHTRVPFRERPVGTHLGFSCRGDRPASAQ